MGVWDRLMGKAEDPRPLLVAVAGEGAEADRLAAAYAALPGCEVLRVDAASALELAGRRGADALELCLPAADARLVALAGLRAGLFVSTPCPSDRTGLAELVATAPKPGALRVRLLPLFYPPYARVKRLMDDDAVGAPVMLKLAVRYGKGVVLPEPLDPRAWIAEREVGFLALAAWLVGPAVKASGRIEPLRIGPDAASSVLTWRFGGDHQYGYLQLDFCPGLHVRTFTDPIHRSFELTGLGGVIMATRGEGQLLRQPPIIIRGKSTTTAFELTPDDWRDTDTALAQDAAAFLRTGATTVPTPDLADQALRILELA